MIETMIAPETAGTATDLCVQAVRPLGRYYYVRVPRAEERLPSGLILPDTCRDNWTDGVVLASGPGDRHLCPGHSRQWVPFHTSQWAYPGDRVLFDVAALDVLEHGPDGALGFVSDEHLVAIIRGPAHTEMEPANDYVLVEVDAAETHSGGVVIPDDQRLRPRSGIVVDRGPGRVRRGGPHAGTRRSLVDVVNGLLVGQRVFWGDHARTVDAWSQSDQAGSLFVCAEDLLAVEEE